MNIINEFFVSFILIKLYFKFKVCRKIKFPLLWKFYFSKWKFYFSADKIILKSFNTATLEHIKKARKKLEILFHKNAKFVAKKSDFKLFPYRKNVKRYCKILGKL